MASRAMEWMNTMVSEPYYLSHFLVFFSYLPIRISLSPHTTHLLLHREIQALLAFLVLTSVKVVKEETWEGFIADALFYAKVFLVGITLIIDYHLALWYIVAFLVIFVLTQQPPFQGLGTANRLTPLQLETLLTEGSTSRLCLVEFQASCSSSCIRASRCFTELSITYSNKNLSFGIIDLGLFPNVADRFGISLGDLNQLPTYILFENASEIARFPQFGIEGKSFHATITKRLLCRHFELDRLLLEYVKGK